MLYESLGSDLNANRACRLTIDLEENELKLAMVLAIADNILTRNVLIDREDVIEWLALLLP